MSTFVLPDWVEGALHPSPLITFYYKGTTTPVDLTDAGTITGKIVNSAHVVRDIVGEITVTDAEEGQARWDLDVADVVAGRCTVHVTIPFNSAPSPSKTFAADWYIEKAP